MKTAKYTIQSVEIKCPHCDGDVEEPGTGSLYWVVYEVKAGTVASCVNGHEFKLPKVGR